MSKPTTAEYIRGALYGLAAVGIWASWILAVRLGIRTSLEPWDIVAIRFAVAGLILLPYLLKKGLALDRLGWEGLAAILLGGGAPMVLISYGGLLFAPAAHAASLFTALIPLYVSIVAAVVLGEAFTVAKRIGLVLIVTGVLGIVWGAGGTIGSRQNIGHVLFICADGLTGLGQAIEAAFPQAVHQTCVVHLIRSALRFVSYADRREVAGALKQVYTADTEEAAKAALTEVERKYDGQYPRVARVFRDRWEEFVPFLSYPAEIRYMLYTTNAVESLNSQLRKVLRHRGPFPNDEAVFKLLFLAIRNAKVHWKRPIRWTSTLAQLDIFFEGRLPA